MKNPLLIGGLSAVTTGIIIGLQATLSTRSGLIIGPIRTGFLTNIIGGGLALLLFTLTFALPNADKGTISRQVWILLFFAGLMGVFIIMGISFSLQRAGVTAGLAAVILGQMLVSTIADSAGWGGGEPIPITPMRIGGLLVMAAAVYLLLPRT